MTKSVKDIMTTKLETVGKLPLNRSYIVAAGLEQALYFLSKIKFSDKHISYLRSLQTFKEVGEDFFGYLKQFKFTGTVWAVPEGTILFPNEPIVRIEAPIIEAQIVETYLLSTINFQTLIASKASRIVTAADGKAVIEFGSRRAHGPQAGLLAARAELYWWMCWDFKCSCWLQVRYTGVWYNGPFIYHEF